MGTEGILGAVGTSFQQALEQMEEALSPLCTRVFYKDSNKLAAELSAGKRTRSTQHVYKSQLLMTNIHANWDSAHFSHKITLWYILYNVKRINMQYCAKVLAPYQFVVQDKYVINIYSINPALLNQFKTNLDFQVLPFHANNLHLEKNRIAYVFMYLRVSPSLSQRLRFRPICDRSKSMI